MISEFEHYEPIPAFSFECPICGKKIAPSINAPCPNCGGKGFHDVRARELKKQEKILMK